MFVNFNILNQLGSPAINSNTFANRPAAGQTGRLFVSTDTFEIYRDNGTTWDLIGGPGSSTITGTGTATQVAYFTSSQAIGSSANLFWDNTNSRLGINTATPGAALDIHGTGTIQQINSTSATANSLLAFQRSGTGLWRIGDNYNAGSNFFELYNTAISTNAIAVLAATNKTEFTAVQTYTSGLARGNYFDYNLSVAAGGSFSTPNAITALGASLDLTLAGNATIPSGSRSGLDAYNTVSFTGAGTLTMTQGTQIRPYSNITAGWAFAGSAVGTITHLAGLRILFPDNSGSTVNVTNNYALLINDQTANTGTVSYTSSRWGIYQEGASDLNYFAANVLIKSTVNNGNALQVTGNGNLTGSITAGSLIKSGGLSTQYLMADGSTSTLTNPVTGTGTTNYIPKFTSSSAIGNSQVFDNGTNVGIGTATPAVKLDVAGIVRSSNQFMLGTATDGTTGQFATDNTNNYLDYLGSLIFRNATSSGQRMLLTSSGNLGLGVTPSAWGGNARVLEGANGSALTFNSAAPETAITSNAYYNGSNWIYKTSDEASRYSVNGYNGSHTWEVAASGTAGTAISFTQAMTLDASGRLGIGTTSPTNKLNILNNGNLAVAFRIDDTNANASFVSLNVSNTDAAIIAGGTSAIPFDIYTGGNVRMRITSGGNVGIGTTSPNTILDVNGTINVRTNGYEFGRITTNNVTGNFGGLTFQYNASGTFTTGMVLNGSGNVGIGTTSPTSKLQISDFTSGLPATTGSAARGGFRIANSSNIGFDFGTVAAGQAWIQVSDVNNYASNFALLLNPNGGNVGIGTTSPSEKLEVNGNIKTAAPSGGTAKPWKLGEAGVAVGGANSTAVRVEIDGTTYYLLTAYLP